MSEDWENGFVTPEEAARGDIPARYAAVAGVEVDGDSATVWLLTNEAPVFEAYEVTCYRQRGRWHMCGGFGGFSTSTPPEVKEEARRLGWRDGG